ncbi:MAG: DUF3592 domain-containing protein [Candidatus Sericytochromatia bacterium]
MTGAFGTPLVPEWDWAGSPPGTPPALRRGQQVDVWVDPANPANTVLRRSAPSSSLLFAVTGMVVPVAAAASFVS